MTANPSDIAGLLAISTAGEYQNLKSFTDALFACEDERKLDEMIGGAVTLLVAMQQSFEKLVAERDAYLVANEHLQTRARTAEQALEAAQAKVGVLEAALGQIERWELPETGQFWLNNDGTISDRPMSYGYLYGSNGERDYMRTIARKALAEGGSNG